MIKKSLIEYLQNNDYNVRSETIDEIYLRGVGGGCYLHNLTGLSYEKAVSKGFLLNIYVKNTPVFKTFLN